MRGPYSPSFSVPYQTVETLQIGDQVSVLLHDHHAAALQLAGAISNMENAVDVGNGLPLVRVDVQLDDPSLALINTPSNSKLFSGRNSRSEIRVTLPERDLYFFLQRATENLLPASLRRVL